MKPTSNHKHRSYKQLLQILLIFLVAFTSIKTGLAQTNSHYNYSANPNKNIQKQEPNPNIDREIKFNALQYTLNELLIAYSDSGKYEYVKYLLDQEANPNATNEYGITPLMYASQAGAYSIVELLLNNKADPNMSPFDGNSALHAAVRSFNDSIAELLIEHGANINAKNIMGLTPLHYSAWNGLPYLTDILMYYGANVNIQDIFGYTPLMLSAQSGALTTTKLLLEQNADPNMCNNDGVLPLMIAAQFNDTALLKLLVDYGADINLTNKNGYNALSYAIANNAKNIVVELVQLGAAEKKLSKSYYQIAAESDYKSAKKLVDSLGLKTKLKISIDHIFINTGTLFNNHEFLLGFNAGLTEQVSKLSVGLGVWYRPYTVATLRYRPQGMFQYNEKRQIISLKVNRLFNLKHTKTGKILGAYIGGNLDLIFRNFEGTSSDPKTAVHPGINAGVFYSGQKAKLTFGWDLTGLRTPDASPHRFGISLYYNIAVNKFKIINTEVSHVY